MNPSRMILDVYEMITFPLALIGVLWYVLIETPIFMGRMKAHNFLMDTSVKAEHEEE